MGKVYATGNLMYFWDKYAKCWVLCHMNRWGSYTDHGVETYSNKTALLKAYPHLDFKPAQNTGDF